MPMDTRISEDLVLGAHADRVREAERMTRVLPARPRSRGLAAWTAGRLRAAADRLDDRPQLEIVRPLGQ